MPQSFRPGTLELLALEAIALGGARGFAIVARVKHGSCDRRQTEQRAPHPVRHRLDAQGADRR